MSATRATSAAPDRTPAPPSYRRVLAQPGFPSLIGGMGLARVGQQMSAIAIVLFTLARFHSPSLAGVAVFLLTGTGLLVSPLAGALLDRHGRIRLVTLDYALGAVCFGLIAGLDRAGHLPAWALCLLVTAAALTSPLGNSGTRSLFPLVLARSLWDRANGLDSALFVVALIVGPAIAGVTVAAFGVEAAVVATAVVLALAAVVIRRVPEPTGAAAGAPRGLFSAAGAGIGYVLRSPSLRGLALTLAVFNVGFGVTAVALPVLVLDRFGSGAGTVGLLYALMGVGGLLGALLTGLVDSEGRERQLMAVGMAVSAGGMLCVLVAPSIAVVAAGLLLFGAMNGPIDIGLFSLRQRRTHPEWLGRSFAVSAALNFSGMPIGSLSGGWIVARSTGLAFTIATVACLAGGAVAWLAIPRRWEAPGTPPP